MRMDMLRVILAEKRSKREPNTALTTARAARAARLTVRARKSTAALS